MSLSVFHKPLVTLALITTSVIAHEPPTVDSIPVNPLSVSGLRQLADADPVKFQLEYKRENLQGIQQQVLSFSVDGLRQFILVLTFGLRWEVPLCLEDLFTSDNQRDCKGDSNDGDDKEPPIRNKELLRGC